MKSFIITVASLIISAVLVLCVCMYFIWDKNAGKTAPIVNDVIDEVSTVPTPEKDKPSQEELRAKFSAMYEINEADNSITVISEEYLKVYWAMNSIKESVRSLSVDEVLYIIQDSIDIFYRYDRVILGSFVAESNAPWRFPYFEEEAWYAPVRNQYENVKQIYEIILYRIRMLSSPTAVLEGIPEMHYSHVLKSFYIPGFSDETDREALVNEFIETSIPFELDFFRLDESDDGDGKVISLYSGGVRTQVYPTLEMEEKNKVVLTSSNSTESYIVLNMLNRTFRFKIDVTKRSSCSGSFEIDGDVLKLNCTRYYPSNQHESYFISSYTYIFRSNGNSFRFDSGHSKVDWWLDMSKLEAGSIFTTDNAEFKALFNKE